MSGFVSPIGGSFREALKRSSCAKIYVAARRRKHSSSLHAPVMIAAKLLSAQWLSSQIDSGQSDELTILDVRGRVDKPGGRVSSGFQSVEYISDDEAFFAGHIPGAAFVDWRRIDVARHVELCDMLSQVGVQRNKPICVYDWGDMLFATRLWFALYAIGCEDVGVLNGGWKEWDQCGGAVSLETMCPLKSYSELESTLKDNEIPRQSVCLEEMRSIVGQSESTMHDTIIIDARSAKQYTGQERRALREGHLPGAVNVPYRTMLNENGIGFREDSELLAVFQERGLLSSLSTTSANNEANFVVYCNGGVSSTVVMFGLVRCGVPLRRIRNYCGSFSEWANLEDTSLVVGT